MVKLSKNQLSEAIAFHLENKEGLDEIFKMTLEGLMKLERQEVVSQDDNNKANGYRKRWCSGLGKGYKINIPRDRLGLFRPYILELLKEDDNRIKDACFELYSKGITTTDVSEIIKKLYGKEYSESGISSITQGFYEDMEKWRNRFLEKNYAVIFIDSIFIKVRRNTVESEAFYVLLGVREDATREVLGIYNYPTESSTNWVEIFKKIANRGVEKISLVVSDGLTGIESALKQVYPQTPLQTCIVHYQRNLMREIRPKNKVEFGQDLQQVFQTHLHDDTEIKCKERMKILSNKWEKIYPKISKKINEDVTNKHILFEYLKYDYRVRPMIYTTNWIERLNRKFRKTLKVRGALPSIESALLLLTTTSIDIGDDTYKYKISSFKLEPKLFDFKAQKNIYINKNNA